MLQKHLNWHNMMSRCSQCAAFYMIMIVQKIRYHYVVMLYCLMKRLVFSELSNMNNTRKCIAVLQKYFKWQSGAPAKNQWIKYLFPPSVTVANQSVSSRGWVVKHTTLTAGDRGWVVKHTTLTAGDCCSRLTALLRLHIVWGCLVESSGTNYS